MTLPQPPASDRQALVEVIHLGLLWHCLCAITRLEVPERLAGGPLPVPELAAAVGADQDALRRVLRLAADHRIVTLQDGRAAAPSVLGMPYWEYLAAHPDQQALFDQSICWPACCTTGTTPTRPAS